MLSFLQMNGLTTRDYMEDYCIYRIRKEVPLPNYDHVRDDPVNAVAARIREIGDLFDKFCSYKYFSTFEQYDLSIIYRPPIVMSPRQKVSFVLSG